MPLINERISNPENDLNYNHPIPVNHPGPVGSGPINSLSPDGNPAPNRGIFPIENMYDEQIYRFFPATPYFVRANVDVNLSVRNLALQAYVRSGGTIN
jgi:hypothetical protein